MRLTENEDRPLVNEISLLLVIRHVHNETPGTAYTNLVHNTVVFCSTLVKHIIQH